MDKGIMEATGRASNASRLRKWKPCDDDLALTTVRIRWPHLRAAVARYVGFPKLADKAILSAIRGEEPYVAVVRFAFRHRHDRRGRKCL